MGKAGSTGPETPTASPQATTLPVSTTYLPSHPNLDEALLAWAEERLEGIWEDCDACGGAGNVPGSGGPCSVCYGAGRTPRYAYMLAEAELNDAQRESVGRDQLLEPREGEWDPFKLEGPWADR